MKKPKHLLPEFIQAMDDIGKYGFEKYGKDSFQARSKRGDTSRGYSRRTQPYTIANHARDHYDAYLKGELHDHFKTKRHQLAAVAFNAMMEYYFAGLIAEDSK